MLSEEEKKAIELLTKKVDDWNCKRPKNLLIFTEIVDEIDKDNNAIKTVLNLITKLQKEIENLKREKEENKFIIAMANNEMLGYNQGYSDGKNENINATEFIIKNREVYMHKEEVEFYKRKIKFLQKENEEKDKQIIALNQLIDKEM